MTLEQFLDELEQTPRDWFLTASGFIRRLDAGHLHCPIEAVLAKTSALTINIAFRRSWVMDAADNNCEGVRRLEKVALRTQLFQRTGLAEPEAQQ